MGSTVVEAVQAASDLQMVAGFDVNADSDRPGAFPLFNDLSQALAQSAPDVVVDFTIPRAVFDNAKLCLGAGARVVVGTTGLVQKQIADLEASVPAGGCLFIAPNFAIGAVLLMRFAAEAAPYFDDLQVIEQHRAGKLDAPSGTALATAQMMAASRSRAASPALRPYQGDAAAYGMDVSGIKLHSMRSDGFVANQEVLCASAGQTLSLKHENIDRHAYMPGVLLAIREVMGRQGLIVGLENLMDL
jgi:4-hydroxy-tetrahydrodipicolinate reductase